MVRVFVKRYVYMDPIVTYIYGVLAQLHVRTDSEDLGKTRPTHMHEQTQKSTICPPFFKILIEFAGRDVRQNILGKLWDAKNVGKRTCTCMKYRYRYM